MSFSNVQPVLHLRLLESSAKEQGVDLAAEGHEAQTGGEDMPHAYRYTPVAPEDLCTTVLASLLICLSRPDFFLI